MTLFRIARAARAARMETGERGRALLSSSRGWGPRLASCSLLRRRIPLEEVPEDEDKCSAWLHKLYQEKVSAAGRPAPPEGWCLVAPRALRALAGGGRLPPPETSQWK